mmetsp:Transcript_21813/g.45375  ORF Transcript_21813/g.45375 Transcript_21813/m.45375 type:complete len:93 (+) Transcript_21813:243-521(+)
MSFEFMFLEIEVCPLGSDVEVQADRIRCLDRLDNDWDLLGILVDCLVWTRMVLELHMVDGCCFMWVRLFVVGCGAGRELYYFRIYYFLMNYC